MKISLILFSLSFSILAGQGIITTLEAPIFHKQSIDSTVIQYARKGQTIYIHNKHFVDGPLDVIYDESDNFVANRDSIIDYEDYYETKDNNGQKAYISKYYVKLITHDEREFTQNITPFDPDPNDYRLEEPLPENYPLVKKNKYRATMSFSAGPDIRSNYNYNEVLEREDFSNRYGFNLSYGRKANWDKKDRFYFGGILHGWTALSKFELFDDRRTKEIKSQIGVGPFVSYDIWRNSDSTVTALGSISLNYTRNVVEQASLDGLEEQRIFSSLSFSPRIASFYQLKTNIPGVDFIAGFDMQFYLPQELRSSKQAELSAFWNEQGSNQDTVYIPFTAHWSAFIGIQSRY
jgi:hypothetical protein